MSSISEKLLLDKMTAIRTATKSRAMYWTLSRCRVHWILGERQECLSWLYQASQLAWYKPQILDLLDNCVDLVYEIDPDVVSTRWSETPEVRSKALVLESKRTRLLPAIEAVYKRTRQKSVRFYLCSLVNTKWPVRQLVCLMRTEFIAAYKCSDSVHDLIVCALLAIIKDES